MLLAFFYARSFARSQTHFSNEMEIKILHKTAVQWEVNIKSRQNPAIVESKISAAFDNTCYNGTLGLGI